MIVKNQKIGSIGEKIAFSYLKKNKFNILSRHFTSRWGELDIVAKKGEKIHFIEVKTRVGEKKGKPYEAVNYFKIRALRRTIEYYLLKNKLFNFKLSLDVISIILNNNLTLKEINFYENIDN